MEYKSMEYQCKVTEQHAQPSLSVRTHTPVDKLPQAMGESYMLIAQYLEKIGEHPAGPPFAMYHNMDMENLDVEMGFPVRRSIAGEGEIQVTELPGGKVGTCLYVGPYKEIEQGYNALLDWMVGNQFEATGIAYEVYLNDPTHTPAHELQTLIVFPLAEK